MDRGLYIATVGMQTQMKKMDVVSNNIANVNTTGYKKDGVSTRTFDEELILRLHDEKPIPTPLGFEKTPIGNLSFGLSVDTVFTDFTSGSLQQTNAPLDIAISGDGFFSVQYTNAKGEVTEKYSRSGSLGLTPDGIITTNEGHPILGQNGPITLPPNTVPVINENGQIFVGSELIDEIKLTAFENNGYLKKFGENMYDLMDGSTVKPFKGSVEQGFVESSNVNSVSEMVEMIALSRAYEANQKVIQTIDSTLSKTVNEVGRK